MPDKPEFAYCCAGVGPVAVYLFLMMFGTITGLCRQLVADSQVSMQ